MSSRGRHSRRGTSPHHPVFFPSLLNHPEIPPKLRLRRDDTLVAFLSEWGDTFHTWRNDVGWERPTTLTGGAALFSHSLYTSLSNDGDLDAAGVGEVLLNLLGDIAGENLELVV